MIKDILNKCWSKLKTDIPTEEVITQAKDWLAYYEDLLSRLQASPIVIPEFRFNQHGQREVFVLDSYVAVARNERYDATGRLAYFEVSDYCYPSKDNGFSWVFIGDRNNKAEFKVYTFEQYSDRLKALDNAQKDSVMIGDPRVTEVGRRK